MSFAEGAPAPQARRTELVWIGIVGFWMIGVVAALGILALRDNSSSTAGLSAPNDGDAVDITTFTQRAQTLVNTYSTRSTIDSAVTVVKPPPGTDIYIVGRLWEWWPRYEVQANTSYRLHLSSADWVHGFSLPDEDLEIQVLPGVETIVTFTPTRPGTQSLLCNIYCGVGHDAMTGTLYVVEGDR